MPSLIRVSPRAARGVGALALLLGSTRAHAATIPWQMCWSAAPNGANYDYAFTLTTTTATTAGYMNWLIFGDYGTYAPAGATTINGASLLSAPGGTSWTSLTSSGGYHNGPTFLSTSPSISGSGWYVTGAVGQFITWSVRGTNLVPDTGMYWSWLVGTVSPSVAWSQAVKGTTTLYRDADGDGYGDASVTTSGCGAASGYVTDSSDCDDTNAAIHPGATETCNSADDDCDSAIDEGLGSTWYRDSDGDAYGDTSSVTIACTAPSGYISNGTDCNDANAAIHPGATEYCNGIDDDCDSVIDDSAADATAWYRDSDGDAYGNVSVTVSSCTLPSGYVADSADCNDAAASIHPGATEYCNDLDDDCDSVIDEGAVDGATWYADDDGDTFGDLADTFVVCDQPTGFVPDDADCDDTDAAVNPDALEVCNGIDDDCDGTADVGADDPDTFYADGDSDGYGDAATSIDECTAPAGYIVDDADCNDADAAVHPGADEYCNGVDDDCNTLVDDGALDAATWYADSDGDTFGDDAARLADCSAPAGYLADNTDCDDLDAAVHPGADELCNGVDDDCDTTVDEGAVDAATWYADADGDSFGDLASTLADCSAPAGYLADASDCDDTDAAVYPGADELCNGVDDDCDTLVDNGATDAVDWYADADSDSYGDPAVIVAECAAPAGYLADDTDCDDADAAVNPGANEVCNGVDDDCDTLIDDSATDALTWYADADGDAFGDVAATLAACTLPAGYLADATDCDDTDAAVYPGATEVCNGVDDDCDTIVDDGATDAVAWYADADGDAFGDPLAVTNECTPPAGYLADATDCDDTDAAVYPGAPEVCNDVDDDCNTLVDDAATDALTWFADADGDTFGDAANTLDACEAPDGFLDDDTDCDDTDPDVYPGAPEVPYDGIDQDCDGLDVLDADGDGYTASSSGGDDCDDSDSTVSPSGTEVADGVDSNCDGVVDEGTDWYDDDADGYTEDGGDCDDDDDATSPAGTETADGIDEDCDGVVDDHTDAYDDDGDGLSEDDGDCNDGDDRQSPDNVEVSGNGIDDDCDGAVDDGVNDPDGDGYTDIGGDCETEDGRVHPGAEEVEDGKDNDCDGVIDEGTPSADGDGDGTSAADGDCNDDDATVEPGADDVADGVDNDCDGDVDEGTDQFDDDGDGFTEEGGDCDDANTAVSPAADEVANGIDDDCDGQVDAGSLDVDGDGYTVDAGDCDDTNGWANPGLAEMCDGIDNNCDGVSDEDCDEVDDTFTKTGDCGCATAPDASGAGVLFGLVAVMGLGGAIRRRQA